jgi:NADH:ubiquinone oxidoreductase subunit E
MYGAEFEKKVDEIVGRYPEPKAALLPLLWAVQRKRGFVDLEAEEWVGARLGVSTAHVHGCVTFYTMYKRPSGKPHPGPHHGSACCALGRAGGAHPGKLRSGARRDTGRQVLAVCVSARARAAPRRCCS